MLFEMFKPVGTPVPLFGSSSLMYKSSRENKHFQRHITPVPDRTLPSSKHETQKYQKTSPIPSISLVALSAEAASELDILLCGR